MRRRLALPSPDVLALRLDPLEEPNHVDQDRRTHRRNYEAPDGAARGNPDLTEDDPPDECPQHAKHDVANDAEARPLGELARQPACDQPNQKKPENVHGNPFVFRLPPEPAIAGVPTSTLHDPTTRVDLSRRYTWSIAQSMLYGADVVHGTQRNHTMRIVLGKSFLHYVQRIALDRNLC